VRRPHRGGFRRASQAEEAPGLIGRLTGKKIGPIMHDL
jgi:hypothetical protein